MTYPLVLVTGASGYLGRLVARRLLDDGIDVMLAVRSAEGRNGAEVALGPVAGRARFVFGDLKDPEPFGGLGDADRRRITRIVHTAAVTRFNVEREVAEAVNVQGTRRVLDLARACPALESLTSVSTVYSSGLRAGSVVEERLDDRAGFANAYEWSKWAAEELVFDAGDLPWRILRVATVVADDHGGGVTQYNAFHETLKLYFYGLLSLVPGRADTPLYLVTGSFAADAVTRLSDPAAPGGVYHVAHDRPESLTLDEVFDLVFKEFQADDDFRAKRILRPLLVDEESFNLLVGGVSPFAGSLVTRALANVVPFARQLYVAKQLDNRRLRAVLRDYRAPDPSELVRSTCRHLVSTRWGRRPVRA